jgi:ADP-ribose pyrophosphatase YjhB (NUDIX family)
MSSQTIRALALCIFHSNGCILVNETHDHVRNQSYCRPLGGGIMFGETSADAIVREIREELGAEIGDLQILGTLENIFTYLGKPHHEIIQIYDGVFKDRELYKLPWLSGTESDGSTFKAVWREMSYFSASSILVPNGLPELLKTSVSLDSPV